MKFKKLGFEIEFETCYGKKYYRKKAAEKAANENIDYLCERYNYTR